MDKALTAYNVDNEKSRGCGYGCFGLVVLLSSACLYPFFVRPIYLAVTSYSWVETPCTMIAGGIEGDGEFSRVVIEYEYVVDQTKYVSDRYDFTDSSENFRGGAANFAAQHPAGTKTVCYVNPRDPSFSVISRSISKSVFLGLIPLFCLGVGCLGFHFQTHSWGVDFIDSASAQHARATTELETGSFPRIAEVVPAKKKRRRRPRPRRSTPRSRPKSVARPKSRSRRIPLTDSVAAQKVTALMRALGFGGATLVVTLVIAASIGISGHGFDWFAIFPFAIFGLVPIAMVAATTYYVMALFNPYVTMTVDSAQMSLGSSNRLWWKFTGNTSRIRFLKVVLLAEERATYRAGTTDITDKKAFYKAVLVTLNQATEEISKGTVDIEIPKGLMHSFDARNNKIVWSINVDAEIAFRPDIKMEIPITIRP